MCSSLAPTRRTLTPHPKLLNPIVDFKALPQADWWAADAVVCCLGTTLKLAGSPAAFREVDHDHVLAAARAGGWIDRIVMAVSVLGFSVPVFVIAYGLIFTFSVWLEWLPVQGYRRLFGEFSQGVGAWAYQLVLPWLSLATIYVALIARVTRASVSEALTEDCAARWKTISASMSSTASAKPSGERMSPIR